MVMPEHPERFVEGVGGLFSFSSKKVVLVEVVENTDGGSCHTKRGFTKVYRILA